MKLQGVVYRIFAPVQVSEKLTKAELVISIQDSKYEQKISFQALNSACDQLRGLTIGDAVEVTFDIKGREWTSPKNEVKFFNSLDIYKVVNMRTGEIMGDTKTDAKGTTMPDEDGLPF